jgi:ABC-2 type transport system permease protein
MLARLVVSTVRAQLQMTRRNVEDLLPVASIPLSAIITLAILVNSGRSDLAGYALVAVVLMTVAQMGLFVGSEIIAQDRHSQTLELFAASPAPYFAVLGTRVFVLSAIGLIGFVEAWLIAWGLFGVRIVVYHPLVLGVTLLIATFASSATALIVVAAASFGRTTRTVQNAIGGPLFLLGGVLVPVTYLPEFLQPFSRGIFLYWAADLLRDALQPPDPLNVPFRLQAVLWLGVIAGAIGFVLIHRMLAHLRREGTLGLA